MSTYETLLNIQNNNRPSIVTLTADDKIYNVNLNTRTIDTIDSIIIESDHNSEVLYFKVPRYYDNVDLYQMTCIINYINAKNESYIYIVPFIDVETYSSDEDSALLIPWEISELVSKEKGSIKFAIEFYRIDDSGENFIYNLNTLQQSFVIKNGIGFTPEEFNAEEQMVETLDTGEPNSSKQYYRKQINYMKASDAKYYDLLEDYIVEYGEDGVPVFNIDSDGYILDSNEQRIVKSVEFIKCAIPLVAFLTEEKYYEKQDLYKYSAEYLKYIQEMADAANEGSLTWIVLK